MLKTIKKSFLAVVLTVVALFALASCTIFGPSTGTGNTADPQTALNEFTNKVSFANMNEVTTSFNLAIAGKNSGYNIPIVWTTDNAAVINVVDLIENGAVSTYYKQAKVTRPAHGEGNATVTLTASFSLTNQGQTYTAEKTYTFVVLEETSAISKGSLADIKAAASQFYFVDNGVQPGASSKDLEFPCEFDATVTAVLGADGAGQFMVSDGTAGIYVYSNKTAVKVGDEVHVKGSITSYYGVLQVGSNIEVTVTDIADQTITYAETSIDALHKQALDGGYFGGQTLKLTGKLLYGKYNANTSDSYWLEDALTGAQTLVYYKSYTADEDTTLQSYVGKNITVNAVTYDKYSTYTPYNSRVFLNVASITETTAPTLTDQDKVNQAVSKVNALVLADAYYNGDAFAFPTVEVAEGVTLTWAMDPATILVDGALVVAADGTAKMVATIVCGEITETVELTINVVAVKPSNPEPAVTNKTVAELIALDSALEMKASYKVTGKVAAFGSKLDVTTNPADKYGNMILEADGQKIIVYGSTATASALVWNDLDGVYTYTNAKDFLDNELTKTIIVGSTVELLVVRTSYNGNPQLNAIVLTVNNDGAEAPTETPEPAVTNKTVAELLAIDAADEMKASYKVTGTVAAFGNKLDVTDAAADKYGNMILEADGSKIIVYGSTATTSALTWVATSGVYSYSNAKDFLDNALTSTITVGATVELQVVRTSYNGTPQLNAIVLSVNGQGSTPDTPEVPENAQTITLDFNANAATWISADAAAAEATFTVDGVTFAYSQVRSSGYEGSSFIMFQKSAASYLYNTTAVPGKILSVEFTVPSGASASAVYWAGLYATAQSGNVLTGTTATGKGISFTVTATEADGYSFFNISGDGTTGKNGQLNKIVITYVPTEGGETPTEPTDAEKLAADKTALNLAASVSADFNLAATGTNGSTIAWAVTEGDAIAIEEGVAKVTRGAADATVKLTATLTLGEATDTKEFTVTVAGVKVAPAATAKTVAELLALDAALEMTATYTTTAKVAAFGSKLDVTDAAADKYGNMILEADGSKIIVYGSSVTASALTWDDVTGKYTYTNAKDFLTNETTATIVVGSELDLLVVRTSYKGTPQLNAVILAVRNATTPEEPEQPEQPDTPDTPVVPAANRADLETLADAHSGSYKSYTSTNGWAVANAAYNWGDDDATKVSNPVFGCLGDSTVRAITLNGKTTAVGSLVSPKLTGGIASLTFKYTHLFSDTNFALTINVKNAEGTVVATTTLSWNSTDVARYAQNDFSWTLETPVEGEFTLEIINACPSASTSNKDRATIWNVEWVSYTAPAETPAETTLNFVVADYLTANADTTNLKGDTKLDDVITMTIDGGSNSGKVYNGDHIRIYATDTPAGSVKLTAAEGYEIVSVKVTTLTGTYAFFQVEGNSAEDLCNTLVEVNAGTVTFNSVKNGTDGKQVRVTAIEVIYKAIA